jgi:hypothetical protein
MLVPATHRKVHALGRSGCGNTTFLRLTSLPDGPRGPTLDASERRRSNQLEMTAPAELRDLGIVQ